MEFLIYIYASQTKTKGELIKFRCPRCGRVIFQHNSQQMLLSNAYGAGSKQLPPGNNFIRYVCHSCKSVFKILFQ